MKPKKIVLVVDDQKRFGAEVFDLIRTKLAPMVGGNVNFGVKLAADSFVPRKPGEVTVAEMRDAIPQIAAKFTAEAKQPTNGSDGRLPLNDEAQKFWDSGEWRGKLTAHGLRQRFAAEIKDGVDLTRSMVEAYVTEQVAEKAKVSELVDEKADPDSKPVACESPVHRGSSDPFQPTVRYRLTRNDAGGLVRMKHPKGDDFIEVGNFLVVPAGDEEKSVDRAVPYCADCREAAWALGRETETKVIFYTASSAKRKLDAMKRAVEGHDALAAQLRSAGAKTFGGGYGTRKLGDWRRDRSGRGGIGTHNKR